VSHPTGPVMAAVPHRHPMLLLDRVLERVPGQRGLAMKAVSANEVQGGRSRTLIVDALGQLAILVLAPADAPPAVYYLAEITGVEFDRPPAPGDVLTLEATVQKTWGRTSRVRVRADVDGRTVATGTLVLSRDTSHDRGETGHV
jgi:3-hydroxyacyl-[acyl-carrier-protein] dehydratase